MTKCVRCGTVNQDAAQYCDECGSQLSSSDKAKTELAAANEIAVASSEPQIRQNPSPVSHSGKTGFKLTIERGKSAGKEFVSGGEEVNIGRWDADNGIFPDVDLDADDPEAKVSRRHARIIRENEEFWLEDLGSTNGTFINRGRRLLPGKRQILQDGDEIIVGKTFLRFQII